jgi:hypothetical protein
VAGEKVAHKPERGNEAPAVNEAELPVTIRLAIPRDLYADYESAAAKQGLTVTELIMHRLYRCKDHNSLRPLYFSDSQRGALETLLQKRPIENAEQALATLNANLHVRISDFPAIPLTPQQVKRIGMGGYAGQTAEQRLIQIVQAAIAKGYGV